MRKNNQTGRILIKCGADKKVNNFLWRTAQMCRYFLTTCTNKVHEDKNIKQMSCYTQETGRSLLPKCSSDAKVNNFLWRTAQMCRYFLTTCIKNIHKRENIKQMSCYTQETGRSLLPKCSSDAKVNNFLWRTAQMCRYFLSAMYKKHTQAKKYHADGLQFGRSMVEMLGVLAIIGVLSVGAIAGYQKAMMKYKLNKQAQQLNHLISVMTKYKNQWKFDDWTYLKNIYIKLGEMPKEMIKDNTEQYIYDVFNNQIYLRNNNAPVFNMLTLRIYILGNKDFAICQNIIQIAKEHSADLYSFQVVNSVSGQEQYPVNLLGDKYCKTNCFRNITLDKIKESCQICEDTSKNQACSFIYVWKID